MKCLVCFSRFLYGSLQIPPIPDTDSVFYLCLDLVLQFLKSHCIWIIIFHRVCHWNLNVGLGQFSETSVSLVGH